MSTWVHTKTHAFIHTHNTHKDRERHTQTSIHTHTHTHRRKYTHHNCAHMRCHMNVSLQQGQEFQREKCDEGTTGRQRKRKGGRGRKRRETFFKWLE